LTLHANRHFTKELEQAVGISSAGDRRTLEIDSKGKEQRKDYEKRNGRGIDGELLLINLVEGENGR
jgi:hypothetical protein